MAKIINCTFSTYQELLFQLNLNLQLVHEQKQLQYKHTKRPLVFICGEQVRHGKVTILLKKADKGKWDNLVPSKKKET